MSETVRLVFFILSAVSAFFWIHRCSQHLDREGMDFGGVVFHIGLSFFSLLLCGHIAGVLK